MNRISLCLLSMLLIPGCSRARPQQGSFKAAALTETKQLAQKETARKPSKHAGRVTFALIDREKSLFRLSNNTNKAIELATLFPDEANKPFTPISIRWEIWKDRSWVTLPYTLNVVGWAYPVAPKKSLDFAISLDYFDGQAKKGNMVRICLDDFPSVPFLW